MNVKKALIFFTAGLLCVVYTGLAAQTRIPSFGLGDTIRFKPEEASFFLKQSLLAEKLWQSNDQPLRHTIQRLLNQYDEPYDSILRRLEKAQLQDIKPRQEIVSLNDTLPLRWLSPQAFIVDTFRFERSPVVKQQTILRRSVELDSLSMNLLSRITDPRKLLDSILRMQDTITEHIVDYEYIKSKNATVHRLVNGRIQPSLLMQNGKNQTYRLLSDSSKAIITTKKAVWLAAPSSGLNILPNQKMTDSLQAAIQSLLKYTYNRDSIMLNIINADGKRRNYWLSGGKNELYRIWVKNLDNDSVTIWVGNPSKYSVQLLLEEDITVGRLSKQVIETPLHVERPVRSLLKLKPLPEIPVYWKHGFSTTFSLNQNYLANWARGGESSFSGMFDMHASGIYTKKASKEQWTNTGRLRYGAIRSKEKGFRTSADILEINSQFNKGFTKKLDFSSVFYFKTQVARGYNYPNDSVVVSKFLNPGTFTIGAGVEYKPRKSTQINFSVLSYKNTFVLDTASINQTAHGIERSLRSKQEMGAQMVIRNNMTILDGLKINTAIRLFTNYLNKPENVDVDWEMSFEKQINWYSTVRLNLHMIYDDDIMFPVLDDAGKPIMVDGKVRKAPRTQFNQFLGLTLAVKI